MFEWSSKLRDRRSRTREPASRSYRYLSRLIERDFERQDRGTCLAFFSIDSDRICADALLMLAHSLRSELGGAVLIIDGSVKTSSGGISERMGLVGLPGYSDLMRGPIADQPLAVHHSAVEGVDVLPVGTVTGTTAVIDRAQLRLLLDTARSQYRHVLLQIGSVLSDTRYLVAATQANGVFILASENETLMRSLDESQRLLRANGVQQIRVVVVGSED